VASAAVRKLKLMTILGTRPEIIRLSEVIKKCDIYLGLYAEQDFL